MASTNVAGKGGRLKVGDVWTSSEKHIELFSEWEFRERFNIPHRVVIRLMNDDPMSTKKEPFNATVFSKEKFNVGLLFPLSSLFKQFLHFTKIFPTFLYPNAVRVLMGCNILNMLFHLDLFPLEVLFIYTIKMSEK